MESLLLDIIKKNPRNWRDVIPRHSGIKIKEDTNDGLVIFNYAIASDFSDPVVQEARGIIIDVNRLKVVCWPFRKFGKYNDYYADTIDWSTARVQEKVDGSIMKLWWNEHHNRWQVSSNGVINADNCFLDAEQNINLGKLFRDAENYKDIPFDKLDKNLTYIFELTSPKNIVVVKHNKVELWHIGTRSNIDGTEYDVDVGIQKPKLYDYSSLEECVAATNQMNKSKDNKLSEVESEGFVVVDGNWNRIKIKTPIYMMLHGITSSGNSIAKKSIIGFLWNHELDVETLCNDFPRLAHFIKYYDFKVTEFRIDVEKLIGVTKTLYKRFNENRGRVGRRIGNHKYSAFGFAALDHPEKTMDEIFEMFGIEKIAKFIPDYIPQNLSSLFKDPEEDKPEEKKEPEVIGKGKKKKRK